VVPDLRHLNGNGLDNGCDEDARASEAKEDEEEVGGDDGKLLHLEAKGSDGGSVRELVEAQGNDGEEVSNRKIEHHYLSVKVTKQ